MANVELILLQRVEKLGQMGEVVNVKPGYARNFLLPQSKAVRATKANRERFERERVQLEAQNLKRREEAERVAERVFGLSVVLIRQAGDSGSLFGSVSARDIADACNRCRPDDRTQPGAPGTTDQDAWRLLCTRRIAPGSCDRREGKRRPQRPRKPRNRPAARASRLRRTKPRNLGRYSARKRKPLNPKPFPTKTLKLSALGHARLETYRDHGPTAFQAPFFGIDQP